MTGLTGLSLTLSHSQVDLEKTKRISGIVTQGAKDFGVVQFVSVFKVAYSHDGESWNTVKEENDSGDKVRVQNTANTLNVFLCW